MNGKVYNKYPEILVDSFTGMTTDYSKKTQSVSESRSKLISLYLKLFGIPEIGFQIRYLYFLKALGRIKSLDSKSVLDAGSGIGYYIYEMSRKFPNAKLFGYELDSIKLDFTKNRFVELSSKNINIRQIDLTKMTDKNKFNLIVNVDVLEHVEDYQAILKNLYRGLKNNGYLYIHTPSINQRRYFPKYFNGWEHEEHVRVGFDKSSLESDLRSIGFKVVDSRYSHGKLGSLAWEINHILLKKSFVLSGILFPFLYILAVIDSKLTNKNGLCLSILVNK